MMTIVETSLNAILSLCMTIIKIILSPIDLIIVNYLPDINNLSINISNFLDLCMTNIGWVIDAFMIPAGVITLIIAYLVFKYTVQFAIWSIKLVISWIGALK